MRKTLGCDSMGGEHTERKGAPEGVPGLKESGRPKAAAGSEAIEGSGHITVTGIA